MTEMSDTELLEALGVTVEAERKSARTPRQERMIAGFEEIQNFVDEHGHRPEHGEDRDIFERLYAVRLDRLREQQDCRELLSGLDHQGLLDGARAASTALPEAIGDDELLAELGVEAAATDDHLVDYQVVVAQDVLRPDDWSIFPIELNVDNLFHISGGNCPKTVEQRMSASDGLARADQLLAVIPLVSCSGHRL